MNISTQSLQTALATLGAGHVRPAVEAYAVMGVRPQVVIEPETEEEVAAVLCFADEHGLAVLPRGGGTHRSMGNAPRAGDIVLSLARLNQVLEHTPHDQTVTVQAGLCLDDLQATLSQTRQWLALDPPHAEDATIGGLISTNVSGPRRLRYGGVRDQLIGIRVALPDGTIARGGGKVVKNVAGYDLAKLYTSALGTLGVVLAASFRLYPLAVASRTVVLEASSPVPLCSLVLRILASTLVPSALDILGATDSQTHTLAIRFESGVEAAVDEQVAAIFEMASDEIAAHRTLAGDEETAFWSNSQNLALAGDVVGVSGGRPPAPAPETNGAPSDPLITCTLKASLLPSEVADWLDTLMPGPSTAGVRADWVAHAGHGLVTVRLDGPLHAVAGDILFLRHAAQERRGTLVVTDAPPELAARVDAWGVVAHTPTHEVMLRLKQQFDPHGILNPGRFVGGI